ISPLQGIREFCGNSVEVNFEEGCGLMGDMVTIPAQYMRSETGEPGLHVDYFNNKNLSGKPAQTGTDPLIDFSWGWAAPTEGINKGNYSVRWTGILRPP